MAQAFHRTLTARGWFLQRYPARAPPFCKRTWLGMKCPGGGGGKYSGNSGGDGLFHIALDSYFIWFSPNRRGFILEGKMNLQGSHPNVPLDMGYHTPVICTVLRSMPATCTIVNLLALFSRP